MELWLLVLLCAVATYFWRGLGVLLSGRIKADGEIFRWVECVAYAMVAGLIVRMIVMPTGTLAMSPLWERLLACAAALVVYWLTKKNLFIAVGAGLATIVAAAYWH